MKKNGGVRASTVRSSEAVSREPWRKWLMTLLALGFAAFVITLLSKQNKILFTNLHNKTASVPEVEVPYYPVKFILPKGWIMTEGCGYEGSEGRGRCDEFEFLESADRSVILDTDIDPEAMTVYLQNTDKFPLFGGAPHEAISDRYKSNDVALIEVTKIDGQEILTGNTGKVTDMGGNFYKVEICDSEVKGPECAMYGGLTHEYYFFGETGAYRMVANSAWSGGVEAIEQIIFSATEE